MSTALISSPVIEIEGKSHSSSPLTYQLGRYVIDTCRSQIDQVINLVKTFCDFSLRDYLNLFSVYFFYAGGLDTRWLWAARVLSHAFCIA